MTMRFELAHQLLEIVDLAVVSDRDSVVFVEQGLRPARQVDDRQSAVAQADSRLHMQPAAIGPAVSENVSHPPQQSAIDFALFAAVKNSGYPAQDQDLEGTALSSSS